jgi:hypothetical protein
MAIFGVSTSDDHLENVGECTAAADLWNAIIDLFQRKTMPSKLTTRRMFYSAKMAENDKALAFTSRFRQLAADCKAMEVKIDDTEMAMTVLCGLPQNYEHLIVAIDAATDNFNLSMDFVKSRLLQDEQRMLDRDKAMPSHDAALINKPNTGGGGPCNHCDKPNHTGPRCWRNPHLFV